MTTVQKRSIRISGHATSISLEDAFWDALGEIAVRRDISIAALVAEVDARRIETATTANLSSALRVFVLKCAQAGDAEP